MSKKHYAIIGTGELCPKCKLPMQRRDHGTLREKQINAPYYFSQWDYCTRCNHLQHYEMFKVINDNASARLYTRQQDAYKEREQQLQFFKSI